MKFVDRIFNLLSTLSIDVCFGAVGVGYSIWILLGLNPPFYWWIILTTSVFAIYNADHIWDIYNIEDKEVISSNPRRFFHYRNRQFLIVATIFSAVISIILTIFFAPVSWFIIGISLGLLCALHFALIKYFPLIPKEFIVTTIYILGLFLIPVYEKLNGFWETPIVLFFLILTNAVILNLITNAYMDRNQDSKENFSSLAISLGNLKSIKIIRIMSSMGIFLSGYFVYLLLTNFGTSHLIYILAIALMIPFFILFTIPLLASFDLAWIKKENRYRYLGEWSFAEVFLIGWILEF